MSENNISFLIIFTTIVQLTQQIYVPEEDVNQKPNRYTTGIKTRPGIQFHHNYSRVYHQNTQDHYRPDYQESSRYNEEPSRRPYPIYNAHTYSQRPQNEIYVLNGTRIQKNENPTRKIVMYNKAKRSPKIEVYKSCPRGATGQFVYEFSCNQFLNCWKGRGSVQNCAPGTLFNPKSLECDFPEKVYCVSGPRQSVLRHEKNANNVKQVGCPREFSGLIPYYTDCSKFLNCVSGIENLMDCPNGTLFDVDKNICDFAHKATCFNGQNHELVEQNIDGKLDFESHKKQRLTFKTNEPRCPDGADGLFRHPGDCSKYLNCANGQTYIQNCGPETLFNPDTKTCDYPYNVRCQNSTSGINIVDYDSGYYQKYNTSGQYSTNQNHGNGGYYDSTGYYGTLRPYAHNNHGYDTSKIQTDSHNIYSNYGVYDGTSRQTSSHNFYGSGQSFYDNQKYNQTGYYGRPNYYNNQESGYYNNNMNPSDHNTGYYGLSINPYQPHSNTGYHNLPSQKQRPVYYNNQDNSYRGSNLNQSRGHGINYYDSNFHNYYNNQNTSYQNGLVNRNRGPYKSYYGVTSPSNQNYGYQNSFINRSDGYYDHNRNGNPSGTTSSHRYDHTGNFPNQQNNHYGNRQTTHQRPIYVRPTNHYDTGHQWNRANEGQHDTIPSHDRNNWNQRGQHFNTRPTQIYDDQNAWDQMPYGGANQKKYQKPNLYVNRPTQEDQNRYNQGTHQVWMGSNRNDLDEEGTTTNYQEVVNINHMRKTTRLPYRNSYEPFYGYTSSKTNDLDDTYGTNTYPHETTTRTVHVERLYATDDSKTSGKLWPPPFPSTDVNADYVFENSDDADVSLEAENSMVDTRCGKSHFSCSPNKCVPKTLVCNGVKDCPEGQDELKCLEFVSQFSVKKNKKLAILEKERWDDVSIATCALLCVQSQKVRCKSFNYRKIDKTCLLTDTNESLTGALISYTPFDYYERLNEQLNCSSMFVCGNQKCISRDSICDGQDDCGDRMDEKNCKISDFQYNLELVDSRNSHEGHLQVSAFGRTGYICDDNFGLADAQVACKELGFSLGAIEVKKNSFYHKNGSDVPNDREIFYMMDDVTCLGNETKLMDCDFNGWGVHNCLAGEAVGVVCKSSMEKCPDDYWKCDTGGECLPLTFVCDGLLDCSDGSDEKNHHCEAPTQIRLVNGSNHREGRVEIRHHGIWGTICDDDFNEDAAKVVCKHLGYRGSAYVKKEAYFGSGSGPIWLDQVFCSGNESSVEKCIHWNWGEHNCDHNEDVGVICTDSFGYGERHSTSLVPTLPQEYPERCGLRKDSIFDRQDDVHFRVVRGSLARKGDYPWQAAIRVKGKTAAAHWCGAVIISERFVLTAAHCLVGYAKGAYVIVAGDYNVDDYEGTEQEAYIEDFYIHEGFRQGHKMNNDIALVKLKDRGFRFNDDVQPICLPESGTSYEMEQNCTISGFGSIQSGKSAFSHDLRAGWIPLQKREICTMPHVYGNALSDGMICAGFLDEGIDSCDGDSGGPLACLNQGVFTLYGITSWGHHCGYANKPGVYVKVAHYRKWIDDNFYKQSAS